MDSGDLLFRRYIFPLVSSALALGVRMLLDPVLGTRVPYITFFIAVAAASVVGGAFAGAVAAVAGGLAAAYFIIPPRATILITGADNRVGFALYLIVSTVLIVLAHRQRKAVALLEAEVRRREAAEASERFQRRKFETTLASIGDGVIATDNGGRITFINRVAAELTGWTPADALGQPIDGVFAVRDEDTGEPVENPALRAMRDRQIVGLDNHSVLISKEGKRISIDDSGAPIVDAEGSLAGAVLVFRDVGEAKARDAELRHRARMIDLSHDAIILLDAGRRIVTWNRGAAEIYGFDAAESVGQVIHTLLRSRGSFATSDIDNALHAQGRWDGELIHVCKGGNQIVVDTRQVLLRDNDGAVAGILEINRDVTDRKRIEDELRRAAAEAEQGRRLLDALMENIPEGIAIADAPDVRIRMVSRYGVELLGRPMEALCNTTASERAASWALYHADGKTQARPEELPLTRAVAAGAITTDEEWIVRRPNGETLTILCNAAPIRDAGGRVTGGLIAWRDVTQRKRLEEMLRESAKLESLGVLAGGIAHDFNNLLTGVIGNASLLLEITPEASAGWTFAQHILETAERAAKLTHQMLAYSGHGRFVLERLDISAHIREITPLIEAAIPKHVELSLDLADGLPPVEADASQLRQLLLNLVVNGAEAIKPPAGHVIIATRARTVEEGPALAAGRPPAPGLYVLIEVSDDGCGMDDATIKRIFDPFFTTKFAGRGLGLAAVHGIVRGHMGSIQVHSVPGEGTTFRVFLPVCAAARAVAPTNAPQSRPISQGRDTILVIDDEEIIRSTAYNALRTLGYTVVTASDGVSGVDLFRAIAGQVLVVLLDMTMPGISGEQTMHELRAIRPDVPIVLSSGYSEAEALRRFSGQRLAGFLQKPYSARALAERVNAAAAGGS